VNTVVVEVTRGRDGKRYPAGGQLQREQLNRLRWLAHNLIHRDGMSIRQAQATMLESYGVRRSVGAICQDLHRFECPLCAGQPAGHMPAQEPQPPAAVHQRPGGLTGMVGHG
jgi:hypothetical protein